MLLAFYAAKYLYNNLAVECEAEIAVRMAINEKVLELLK